MAQSHVAVRPTSSFATSTAGVASLFRHIRYGLHELDTLARSAQAMEEDLHSFAESYYARVLPLSIRLERLRYRRKHGIFPPASLLLTLSHTPSQHTGNLLALKKKALFRRLAKLSHPDTGVESLPFTIAEVYAAKTLSALWLLDIRYQCDLLCDGDAMLLYLETQRADIGKTLQEARLHNDNLCTGDMWLLKEKVLEAARGGEDLVEQIVYGLERQIAAMQQLFVRHRKLDTVTGSCL